MKGFKNFLVAFLVASVVMGIAAAIIMGSLEDLFIGSFNKNSDDLADVLNSADEEKEEEEEKTDGENQLANLDGESFNLLLVCTDERTDVYDNYLPAVEDIDVENDEVGFFEDGFRVAGAHNICLVSCNKEKGKFAFAPVSPITSVYTPQGKETLYDIYGVYGMDYFISKVEVLCGMDVDYYAVINCDKMEKIVTTIGAVWCHVPCDIFSNGIDFISATEATAKKVNKNSEGKYDRFLEACTDYIGPSSMGLMLFNDYSNGVDDELEISQSYARGLLANYAKLPSDSFNSVWKTITSYLVSTNIESDFFEKNGRLISAYTDEIAETVLIPGAMATDENTGKPVFAPDTVKAVDAFSAYR